MPSGELSNVRRIGDCREVLLELPDGVFDCCLTSPPYFGMRDYGHPKQIGMEETVGSYVKELVSVFRQVRRVLRADGTLWLNLGDAYANDGKYGGETSGKQAYLDDSNRKRVGRHKRLTGLKAQDLVGLPWMVAFALRDDGWWLRSEIIWHKLNGLPESVKDRPTRAHEHVFLLAKTDPYYYDASAIREEAETGDHHRNVRDDAPCHVPAMGRSGRGNSHKGLRRQPPNWPDRNMRDVWRIPTDPYDDAHFAVMPRALATRCVLAGSRLGGLVLDPFFGTGTVGEVAESLGRRWFGIDLSYDELSRNRTKQVGLPYE